MRDEETVKLTDNIEKRIVTRGKPGRRPSLGWICGISLNWVNLNKKENVEINIGDFCSETDRLIERCVESMHLEEESFFIFKPQTDNSAREVIITLKSATEKPYIFQWTDNEKIEASNKYKEIGAKFFKEDKIKEAFYKFSTALKLMILLNAVLEEDEQESNINNLRVALYNNLANCHLHFKNYPSVVKLCSSSISLSPTIKAFYRRALAYIELKEYEKAENDLTDLLKLDPKNKAALEKYKLVRELDRSNRENYESIVKKMFR